MIPESLTTCFTPAFLAASMKFDWTSSMSGADDEISIARSMPCKQRRERLGARHVALHDLDMWQRCERLGLGRIAHQRAHGNALRR